MAVTDLRVETLSEATWPAFAELVERHNGVWGGCWCMGFHAEGIDQDDVARNREAKQARVREGQAHAALVFDGATCVGWCQFGSVEELPRIKNRRGYDEGLAALPDWRITCFFADRRYRGNGVASVALEGALRAIARLGGGRVESYPEDAEGRKVSMSYLHNGTVAMFERRGFERDRRIGKHRWVVHTVVQPAETAAPGA
jgi:GNAT superfamily N-acetyltransferase